MKRILTIFLYALASHGFSQLGADYKVDCQFNPGDPFKKFSWTSDKFTTKQVNGFLELTHTVADKSFYISDPLDINWQKPFSLKSSFKLQSGPDTKGFGIMFGGSGIDNAFVFNISDNGYYTFFKYEKGKYVELKPWTTSSNVLTGKKTNVIELKGEKGAFNFYINGALTYTHEAMPFYGFDHGYLVTGSVTILSDYFTVYQKQTDKINLIENANKFGSKVKLTSSINSSEDEFCPLVSYDEKTLYLARKKSSYYVNNEYDDDIWYSNFNTKDSTWGIMKNIGKPLNNKANNFIQYVSPDNNTLIVGNHYNAEGEYSGMGFSMSHRVTNGWSLPKKVDIKNYYNHSNYNELCVAPNGRVMLLTLHRDDTHGFKDIYVCFLNSDSTWSEPKNTGSVINTFANETSPFIASDGTTMYFSSSGHPGYGKNDIFMTKRLDETWTNWSAPKNLGPKINSERWDAYYTIPASGKTAYLVLAEDKDDNIYKIKQPESARPDPVVLVKGIVFNSENKQHMQAAIYYSELGSKKTLGHVDSDPQTGIFMLSLPKGKKYSLIASKTHFISVHDNIDLIDLKSYEEKEIDLFLTPIKKGEKLVLNNLFFKANTADILPDSYEELDKIVDILKLNRNLKIEVSGHTSKNNSKPEWNMNLSTNRALAVKNYFIEKGIPENRITHIGYGNTKPIVAGMDEATLAKNRRVELEILEN